jgi:WhiB family redox-sensing transcriptional regulator
VTIRRARSRSEKEWSPGAAGPLLEAEDDRDREWWDGTEPDWRDASLCSQTDPEIFFPEKGGSVRPAKEICRRCPVRVQCLEEVLKDDEPFGIWAGLTDRERRRVRLETPDRPAAEIIADADARYSRRQERQAAAVTSKIAGQRNRRQELAARKREELAA